MSPEFVCEDSLDSNEIQAGLADGVLTTWRVDSRGKRWFRRFPNILGVPKPSDKIVMHDVEVAEDIEAESYLCEIIGEDDDGNELRATSDVPTMRGVDENGTVDWSL